MRDAVTEQNLKAQVKAYWSEEPCDSRYAPDEIERRRYMLEPMIPPFADFESARGRRVLEVGVGLGVDFSRWVRAGARATGIDLTRRAVELTRSRVEAPAALLVADAENLPLRSASFDLVYAWGVLHHTPGTEQAIAEVRRVLRPGGTLKVMVYHVPSWTGLLLWVRHALLAAHPLSSTRRVLFEHLESAGTKSYTCGEIRALLERSGFDDVKTRVELSPSDLLTIELGTKYRSRLYRVVQALYPTRLVRRFGRRLGLYLLIEARRPRTTGSA